MSASKLAAAPPPPLAGEQDVQTVTRGGTPTVPSIDGVTIRPLISQTDHRGEVLELMSEGWPEDFGDGVPHSYLATIVPGVVKGWVCHMGQSDRSVPLFGRLRWVLYDGREDSPTFGLLQKATFTERNRHLIILPPGVWHAVENVGETEAGFINMPTRAYDHEQPDKFRLPLDTADIPFRFPNLP